MEICRMTGSRRVLRTLLVEEGLKMVIADFEREKGFRKLLSSIVENPGVLLNFYSFSDWLVTSESRGVRNLEEARLEGKHIKNEPPVRNSNRKKANETYSYEVLNLLILYMLINSCF